MKQEVCMLPVRCSGCNTIFDLWHVLQEQESSKSADSYGVSKAVKQSLCLRCRNAVFADEDELEESEAGEYEILLDFE